jgi:hypothetical protein
MPPSPAAPRLLLLEFVVREPWIFNSRFFPQVVGLARKHGAQAAWLTFGVSFTIERGGRHGVISYVDLPEADREALRREVERLRPTHVMTSDCVSDAVLGLLHPGGTTPRVMTWSESDDLPGQAVQHVRELNTAALSAAEERMAGKVLRTEDQRWPCEGVWHHGRTDWLLDWLGLGAEAEADRGAYLVGCARPSYDAVMANPLALAYRPRLTIMGGLSCDYRGRARRNPCFQGVDLSNRVYDVGCSFCTAFKGPTSDLRADPVAVAGQQLRAVLEDTRGGDRRSDVYEVHDVRLFLHLERFIDLVLGLGLPPSEFMFSPRVDRFLVAERMLDRVLPRMAAAGHVLNVYRMGAENLNRDENLRLNKGISPEQIDRATGLWHRLNREHPAAFKYDGTYGYIAATPWTTLEDLEAGIREAIRQGFAPLDVWLYAPLELQPASTISDLARHDGVVSQAFEDASLLYKASINNVSVEGLLPWRFRDERAAVAFAIIVRHVAAILRDEFPDAVFRGDRLYEWLLGALGQAQGALKRCDWFAREVVACVREAAPPYDRQALAAEALRRLARLVPPAEVQAAADGTGTAHAGLTRAAALVHARLGRHLEGLRPGEARWDGRAGGPVFLDLEVEGHAYRLLLFGEACDERYLFRTAHFKVAYSSETPLTDVRHARLVKLLLEALDRALAASAPRLLSCLSGAPPAGDAALK